MQTLALACLILIVILAIWVYTMPAGASTMSAVLPIVTTAPTVAAAAPTMVAPTAAASTGTPVGTEHFTPNQYMQIGRGLNALNTGGDYTGPIAELSEIEKMNLENVQL